MAEITKSNPAPAKGTTPAKPAATSHTAATAAATRPASPATSSKPATRPATPAARQAAPVAPARPATPARKADKEQQAREQRRNRPAPPVMRARPRPSDQEPGPSSQSTARGVRSSGGEANVGERERAATLFGSPARPAGFKVQATQTGYIYEARRRAGDVFMLYDPADFSETWMIRVANDTPERITTGAQVLRQRHDQEMAARHPAGVVVGHDHPTGTGDPLGMGEVEGN